MKKNKIIYSLNGIRGFAILLVLFSHASNSGLSMHPNLSFSGAGRYGVFLFFVLSAFLLTRQFLEENFKRGEFNKFVAHYFTRRFLRIFPLFISALIVYYMLHKFGYSIYPINEMVFLKTLFLMDGEGIFWTIPVEFQYYFLIPIISLAFINTKSSTFIVIVVTIFIGVWWYFIPPKYVTHVLPFLPIFLLGSVTAYISSMMNSYISNRNYLINIFNIFAILCVSCFIFLTPNFYNHLFDANIGGTYFHKKFLLFSVLSCCLVFFTVHGNGVIKKTMENRILVFWGNVSFSAYLGHMIILKAITNYIELPPEINFIIFFTLTATFSYLSFKFIELPLSKGHIFRHIFSKFKIKKFGLSGNSRGL